MLRMNWTMFGAAIRAHAIAQASHFTEVEKSLGISHARMINAAQGKPVGTEIYLTLCVWMKIDPRQFVFGSQDRAVAPDEPWVVTWGPKLIHPASVDTLPKGRDAKQGSVRSKGSAVPPAAADAQRS